MNKIFLKIILVSFGIFFVSGCQRDDLCPASTDTTPLLIIKFFDIEEPEETRSPTNLRVWDQERDTILLNRVNVDSIAIPLKTFEDNTEYAFTINAREIDEDEDEDDPNILIPNTDILRFTYGREQVYVNRACAYKVIYSGLRLNIDAGDDEPWIQTYTIEQTEVEDETNRHISIFY
ncbi:MAG: DUF6452 family protein [Bacteroidota bacterium]